MTPDRPELDSRLAREVVRLATGWAEGHHDDVFAWLESRDPLTAAFYTFTLIGCLTQDHNNAGLAFLDELVERIKKLRSDYDETTE